MTCVGLGNWGWARISMQACWEIHYQTEGSILNNYDRATTKSYKLNFDVEIFTLILI